MNKEDELKENELKPALLLAGKLALAARAVTTSSVYDLSIRIKNMEDALNAYDNEVFALIKKGKE